MEQKPVMHSSRNFLNFTRRAMSMSIPSIAIVMDTSKYFREKWVCSWAYEQANALILGAIARATTIWSIIKIRTRQCLQQRLRMVQLTYTVTIVEETHEGNVATFQNAYRKCCCHCPLSIWWAHHMACTTMGKSYNTRNHIFPHKLASPTCWSIVMLALIIYPTCPPFWDICEVTLIITNFTISVTSWHLAFKCTYYYLGMSMFNCVMRCMPMLHDGLQGD